MVLRSLLVSATAILLILSPLSFFAPTVVSGASAGDISAVLMDNWDQSEFMDTIEALCNISSQHFAYRVSGSSGAEEAASFIGSQFEEMGLDTSMEEFDLPSWDLLSEPSLVVDPDGDPNTTEGRSVLSSFNAESYSIPTSEDDPLNEVVILPLPDVASTYYIGSVPIDNDAWDLVNTTGKVLLIGREVRWASNWEAALKDKITRETPAAIVFHYSYEWMNYTDLYSQPSTGGRPLGAAGPMFWDMGIPVGSLNYSEGELLTQMVEDTPHVGVLIDIPSQVGSGTHVNVVADIPSARSDRYVLVGAHYDTVLCEGFIDNTAGVGTVIEMARAIKAAVDSGSLDLGLGLRFVAFDGEELGLAGSINYVEAHQDEMEDIAAVVVIDSIGSTYLYSTYPWSDSGIDLTGHAEEAANTAGTVVSFEDLDASDQVSFLYPTQTADVYNSYWGTDIDLDMVDGVPDSILFYSHPMSIFDMAYGALGFIHTSNDTLADAVESGWVDLDTLNDQALVVALTVASVTGQMPEGGSSAWGILLPIAAAVIVLVFLSLIYIRKRML